MTGDTKKRKESKGAGGKAGRLSMHPLTLEEALRGAMEAGPIPRDTNQRETRPKPRVRDVKGRKEAKKK